MLSVTSEDRAGGSESREFGNQGPRQSDGGFVRHDGKGHKAAALSSLSPALELLAQRHTCSETHQLSPSADGSPLYVLEIMCFCPLQTDIYSGSYDPHTQEELKNQSSWQDKRTALGNHHCGHRLKKNHKMTLQWPATGRK